METTAPYVYETARGDITWTWNAAGTSATANIPYSEWSKWTDDLLVVEPYDENRIALNNQPTFSNDTKYVAVDPVAGDSDSFTVASQGSCTTEVDGYNSVTVYYTFTINYTAGDDGTGMYKYTDTTKTSPLNAVIDYTGSSGVGGASTVSGPVLSLPEVMDEFFLYDGKDEWTFYNNLGNKIADPTDKVTTESVKYALVTVTAENGEVGSYLVLFNNTNDVADFQAGANALVAHLLKDETLSLKVIAQILWRTSGSELGDLHAIRGMEAAGLSAQDIYDRYAIDNQWKNGVAGLFQNMDSETSFTDAELLAVYFDNELADATGKWVEGDITVTRSNNTYNITMVSGTSDELDDAGKMTAWFTAVNADGTMKASSDLSAVDGVAATSTGSGISWHITAYPTATLYVKVPTDDGNSDWTLLTFIPVEE